MIASQETYRNPDYRKLKSEILSTKEFDESEECVLNFSQERIQDKVKGHVVIFLNNNQESLQLAAELIATRKTNLVFFAIFPSICQNLADIIGDNEATTIMQNIRVS
jgi:hypothetical protein